MITCRRHYLDSFLMKESPGMKGHILDIGGKKANKRGEFSPPLEQVQSWKYLNSEASTEPDYCCNAESIPLETESVDGLLLCEVLEHLEHPERVLHEAFRVLKPGGTGWITMPFLYPVHADPHDYQRWTETKLRKTLEEAGFSDVSIEAMGSVIGVIYDLLYASLNRSPNRGAFLNRLFLRLLRTLGPLALLIDAKLMHCSKFINTGYEVVVQK